MVYLFVKRNIKHRNTLDPNNKAQDIDHLQTMTKYFVMQGVWSPIENDEGGDVTWQEAINKIKDFFKD